jgi:hypothetical protein
MPHPTGLDDRPYSISTILLFGINTFNELQTLDGRQYYLSQMQYSLIVQIL